MKTRKTSCLLAELLLFLSTLMTTAALAVTARSDITIVLADDLNRFLYKENVSCEDSACTYTPPFKKKPLWVNDNNGKTLVQIGNSYHLENTTLSIIYSSATNKSTETTSQTQLSFSLGSLSETRSNSKAIQQISTWVLPEASHALAFRSNMDHDTWLSFDKIVLLETNSTSLTQATLTLTKDQAQTSTKNENTSQPPFSNGTLNCEDAINLISNPDCQASSAAVVDGLLFSQNASSLSPQARKLLDQFVPPLKGSGEVRIEIAAYTDSKGPKRWNLQLSKNRAETIRQYLIFKGVRPNKLVSSGYGESNPVASNDTKKGRSLNRRIEIKRLNQD